MPECFQKVACCRDVGKHLYEGKGYIDLNINYAKGAIKIMWYNNKNGIILYTNQRTIPNAPCLAIFEESGLADSGERRRFGTEFTGLIPRPGDLGTRHIFFANSTKFVLAEDHE